LWENGIFQNCLYLVRLFEKSPEVEFACLIAGGNGEIGQATLLADVPMPVLNMSEALQTLDVVIEMSAQLDPRWIEAFDAKGGHVIGMRVGNDYVIDIERMIFDLPHGVLANQAKYDETWTLPQYEKIGSAYYEAMFRAPVKLMPHLWSSEVIDRALTQHGWTQSFAYRPGRKRWRVGIVEPNLCMVKTCFIPLLSIDVAHRANPHFLERMICYNSTQIREKPSFVHFAQQLDVVRHGLGIFENRYPMFCLLGQQVEAIFTHQWENAQNYVYYEVLYGGYPLIHNSPILSDVGYYYPEFDCEVGAKALLDAVTNHDTHLMAYRRSANAFIQALSPEHPRNIETYTQAVIELRQRKPKPRKF
jgi:Protein of unknown function (DUF2827)